MSEDQRKKFEEILFQCGDKVLGPEHVTFKAFQKDLCERPEGKWLIESMKATYNLALEDAAKSATVTSLAVGGDPPDFEPIVDSNSILKLKIQ